MTLQPWHWLVLGIVLMAAELLLPGFFLLWFGIAAVVVAAVVGLAPELAPSLQLLLFALLALVAVAVYLRFFRRPEEGDAPALNRRAEQLVGQVFELDGPLRDGRGRVRAGDTLWPVVGPELPAGAKVRVVGVAGTRLRVEPVITREGEGDPQSSEARGRGP